MGREGGGETKHEEQSFVDCGSTFGCVPKMICFHPMLMLANSARVPDKLVLLVLPPVLVLLSSLPDWPLQVLCREWLLITKIKMIFCHKILI